MITTSCNGCHQQINGHAIQFAAINRSGGYDQLDAELRVRSVGCCDDHRVKTPSCEKRDYVMSRMNEYAWCSFECMIKWLRDIFNVSGWKHLMNEDPSKVTPRKEMR